MPVIPRITGLEAAMMARGHYCCDNATDDDVCRA